MERATMVLRRLGRRVRDLREERGWTQPQCAARAGLSPKHVAAIEKGDVDPSLSALCCLARGFQISLPDLVALVGPAPGHARPTLPLRDWLRARDTLHRLSRYADRMVSHVAEAGLPPRSTPPRYRRRRATRAPASTVAADGEPSRAAS